MPNLIRRARVWLFDWARAFQWCWRIMTKSDIIQSVDSSVTDRLVLVPAALLDDLLELARLAADRLPDPDPLRTALAGSIAAVRQASTIEP